MCDLSISPSDGFFKELSAPALPTLESGETLRTKQQINNNNFCAVASSTGGGGPRVLGRAARLIEGPPPFSLSDREKTTMVERSVSTQEF